MPFDLQARTVLVLVITGLEPQPAGLHRIRNRPLECFRKAPARAACLNSRCFRGSSLTCCPTHDAQQVH